MANQVFAAAVRPKRREAVRGVQPSGAGAAPAEKHSGHADRAQVL